MKLTVLNCIKTLKRYCKLTLNVFLIKKLLVMTENSYLYERYFVSNRNFTTEHFKNV